MWVFLCFLILSWDKDLDFYPKPTRRVKPQVCHLTDSSMTYWKYNGNMLVITIPQSMSAFQIPNNLLPH